MGSPSAGPWWQEHVGHRLYTLPVEGYSPVWGQGMGFELRCATCNDQLIDEFAEVRDGEEG